MSVSSFIAKTGTNPAFIAFNAHCWFAFAVVHAVCALTSAGWPALIAILLAGIKEFWFDARYEVPVQTLIDNLEDFLGYTVGIVLALLALMFGL